MADIKEPNYVHYTRINNITFVEAQKLLASFELRVRNIADSNEYERLLKDEMSLAYKVLFEAFESGALTPNYDGPAYNLSEFGLIDDYYNLDQIKIRTVKFCSWASKLNYNLPEILQKCNMDSDDDAAIEIPERKSAKRAPEPKTPDIKSKDGKPEGPHSEVVELPKASAADNPEPPKTSQKKRTKPPEALTEAVEYVFKILHDEGNTEILKPKSIHEFLRRFKDFAEEKGNRNLHSYVSERIKTVNLSDDYDTVITKERVVKVLGKGNFTEESRTYNKQRISRRLCDLRKKYPLTP
jgi:hypothetical protein